LFLANILAAVIHGGALERYPTLRIVLGESGIGWIPYVIERMDEEYDNRFKGLGLKKKPSEYWRRQCRATFQNDRIGVMLLDTLGIETVMWAPIIPIPTAFSRIPRNISNGNSAICPAQHSARSPARTSGKFYGLVTA